METRDPLLAANEVLDPILSGSDASRSLVAAKCLGLMAGYHSRWKHSEYRIRAVESFVRSDLYNPATQRSSRSFELAGKIDVLATDNTGREVIFDHKTTSQDISDPNGPYWRQLVVEGQVSHYMLLEFLNGNKIDYALWDVIRKPSISPRMLSKKGSMETGMERESPQMFAARLAADCTSERPEWYFQRRQVPRLDEEIYEYATELWLHSQDLLAARRQGYWPRNSGACMLYGSPCQFLGICSGHDSPDSDKWTRKSWVHPELPQFGDGGGTGTDVLTNSRIRTFQTCRRKHHLQYEVGIERVEEEEREALYFGTLFHQALEAYFLTLKSQQEGS